MTVTEVATDSAPVGILCNSSNRPKKGFLKRKPVLSVFRLNACELL